MSSSEEDRHGYRTLRPREQVEVQAKGKPSAKRDGLHSTELTLKIQKRSQLERYTHKVPHVQLL